MLARRNVLPFREEEGAVAAPSWTSKALRVLVPVVGIDLVVQYIAGVLTNAYAPAGGFTDSTDFGVYDLHGLNGYALGIVLLATLVVVGLSRQYLHLGLVAVAFAGSLTAAVAGLAFVGATPNPPAATTLLGAAFLVAFVPIQFLAFRLMKSAPPAPPPYGAGPAPPAAA
jgi:hypothetical protein